MNPPVNPSAFPHTYSDKHETYEGMSLRDWFAGQALSGLLACPDDGVDGFDARVKLAFDYADALLLQREKSP
jgi:hypothetical protein